MPIYIYIYFIDGKATFLLPKIDLHFCSGSHLFSPPLASLKTFLLLLSQVSYVTPILRHGSISRLCLGLSSLGDVNHQHGSEAPKGG